jgi:hypothetical protein
MGCKLAELVEKITTDDAKSHTPSIVHLALVVVNANDLDLPIDLQSFVSVWFTAVFRLDILHRG